MGTGIGRHRTAAGVAAAAMWPCLAFLAAVMCLRGSFVAAQGSLGEGFLSLACGYPGSSPFTDPNGITWQSDANYVSGGQPYGPVNGRFALELQALRFFTDSLKNCYNLPLGTVGQVYIIRAGFLYGNYDQAQQPPDFGVSLGATMWVNSVKLDTAVHYEAIFTANSTSIAVCLLRGRYGNPFINSLELRPLPPNSYGITKTSSVYLYSVKRINFGGATLRYPKDPYDRIWTNWTQDYPGLVRQFPVISTNAPIVYTFSAEDLPPMPVLQTAIRPSVANLPIAFSLPNALSVISPQSYSALYLSVFSADLNTSSAGTVLGLQCDSYSTAPTTLAPPFYAFRIGFTGQVFSNATINCNLAKQGNSSADPIINALELHAIQPIAIGTYGPDVTAMNAIKTAFRRLDWVGDPCLPISWDGVRCSSGDIPRVVGIVLPGDAGTKLGVIIPAAIGSLTSLTQLELENNDLFGPIPNELSALRNLSILNIANNQLTGVFPLWLNTSYLPKLTQVFVQNNFFTGTFSDTLTSLGSNFSYSGGNQLCSATDVSCSGRPSPASPTVPYNPSPSTTSGGSSDKDKLAKIIGGVGGGLIVLLLLLAILAWYISEKKWSKREKERGRAAGFRERLNLANLGKYTGSLGKRDWKKAPLLRLSSNSGQLKTGVADGVAPVRKFRYDELRQATNKFKTKLIEDELGVLYLGNLTRENRKIGVKVLSEFSQLTDEQVRSKVDLSSKLRHANVVPLIGFCLDGSRQILVYEHMEGGELHRLLHDTANTRVLSWRERLNVALGAAKGIDYLHRCSSPVIHGDISSMNILLNDLFEAKIANSGLKNLEPDDSFLNGSGSVSSTQRLGYADPESLVIDQLTEKSDVYSFGVVLLEILCGRQPVSKFPPYDNHMQIVDWVKQSLNGGKVEEIVDSKMRIDYNEQALSKYTALCLKCVESEASRRPNIDFVVRELEETIQLQ